MAMDVHQKQHEVAWVNPKTGEVQTFAVRNTEAELSQRYRVAVSALRCFRGIDIAERAGIRLSKRYRHLVERGKASPTAVMAVVRELVGFLWAMLRQVQEHEHKAA